MSSAIYRQLAFGGEARKAERLFRAAVSAYVSLTRPTRREIAQLDDLALPLLPSVPVETRRYAAALLCECEPVPPKLIRRLCDEPVEISAPLLVRSKALSDVDLIGLIARHGFSHARVIARRANLNPAIAALIKAMLAQTGQSTVAGASENHPDLSAGSIRNSTGEENIRAKLRGMMRTADEIGDAPCQTASLPASPYENMRGFALTNETTRFESALASQLQIPVTSLHDAGDANPADELMTALRALDLSTEQAFLLAAARFPASFQKVDAIRRFVECYEIMSRDTAGRWVADRKDQADAVSNVQSLGLRAFI